MFKKILLALVVLIAAFLGYAAMQPSEFEVARSTTIDAPPDVVFAQVNDFHRWQDWSPWAKMDPKATAIYEGPAAGNGAIFRWAGNQDVGEGNMTIVESVPAERVKIRLEFIKPFAGVSTAEFTFKPVDAKTTVTWRMYGENSFMGKVMGLIMNCEKMMNVQFDKGLAQMKSVSEAVAKK